jgi:hypothetical protein
MNDEAAIIFKEDGGRTLIGRNVFDCHPEPARSESLKAIVRSASGSPAEGDEPVEHPVYPANPQSGMARDAECAGFGGRTS